MAALRSIPTAHRVAVALDEYLALTGPSVAPLGEIMCTPAEAFAAAADQDSFALLFGDNVPREVRALSRLRFEAACEVERLIRLLDALDADPDLEPSLCGWSAIGGPHVPGLVLDGEIDAGEEPEAVNEDGDVLDFGEGEGEAGYDRPKQGGTRFTPVVNAELTPGFYSFATSHQGRFLWCEISERRSDAAAPVVDCFRSKGDAGDTRRAAFSMPLPEFRERAILWLRTV